MHAEEIDGDGVIGLYPHLAPEDERVRVLKDVSQNAPRLQSGILTLLLL